eukprot:gnl/Dysnectes_brevis/5275_a7517_456.p1 GENE.gnl/Dysnectes_brevis/5275_a7517_456~~gnl/Dysnectes_brevis/5275_a7517_456.p1  ORF type:complete len:666 (-),score=109.32 gnl/Dysnectes_brevis/5275_a7517_456:31-2028(-)
MSRDINFQLVLDQFFIFDLSQSKGGEFDTHKTILFNHIIEDLSVMISNIGLYQGVCQFMNMFSKEDTRMINTTCLRTAVYSPEESIFILMSFNRNTAAETPTAASTKSSSSPSSDTDRKHKLNASSIPDSILQQVPRVFYEQIRFHLGSIRRSIQNHGVKETRNILAPFALQFVRDIESPGLSLSSLLGCLEYVEMPPSKYAEIASELQCFVVDHEWIESVALFNIPVDQHQPVRFVRSVGFNRGSLCYLNRWSNQIAKQTSRRCTELQVQLYRFWVNRDGSAHLDPTFKDDHARRKGTLVESPPLTREQHELREEHPVAVMPSPVEGEEDVEDVEAPLPPPSDDSFVLVSHPLRAAPISVRTDPSASGSSVEVESAEVDEDDPSLRASLVGAFDASDPMSLPTPLPSRLLAPVMWIPTYGTSSGADSTSAESVVDEWSIKHHLSAFESPSSVSTDYSPSGPSASTGVCTPAAVAVRGAALMQRYRGVWLNLDGRALMFLTFKETRDLGFDMLPISPENVTPRPRLTRANVLKTQLDSILTRAMSIIAPISSLGSVPASSTSGDWGYIVINRISLAITHREISRNLVQRLLTLHMKMMDDSAVTTLSLPISSNPLTTEVDTRRLVALRGMGDRVVYLVLGGGLDEGQALRHAADLAAQYFLTDGR